MKIKPFITLNFAENNQVRIVRIISDFKLKINQWFKTGILYFFYPYSSNNTVSTFIFP